MAAFKLLSFVIVIILALDATSAYRVPKKTPEKFHVRASSENRTVIFMYKITEWGQDLFIRGGIDSSNRPGCTSDAETDPCAIAWRTRLLGTIDTYDPYNAWRVGDNHLDWHGTEVAQGTYNGNPAEGTPLAWTSNNVLSPAYQELNKYGDHYWMVDTEMDCTETEGGWFELKGFLTNDVVGWEGDISQAACTGGIGGIPTISSSNHVARCGYVNVYIFDDPSCIIDDFPDRSK